MSNNLSSALDFAHQNSARYLDELITFLTLPTISTDPEHKADIQRGAEWIAEKLRKVGVENTKVMPTAGHPVVYGEHLEAGGNAPTIIVYGHYDVQPADPLELWNTGPFEPTQRGDSLYARGASDMKGQVMAAINALEAVSQHGGLGVNVKFLLEGEEEIGSPNLAAFIEEHKDMLACDFALNPDAGMIRPDLPTLTYALRGLAYFEINVTGPDHDLHSGVFGGVVRNPANELMRLVAGMHDTDGRVTLPGFYDKVRELDADERTELARLPLGEEFYLEQTGAPALWGEVGYTPVEQVGARPTLDANGFLSGFTGEGSKTVLPSRAMVKISTRLVPDQTPQDVKESLLQYLNDNANPGIQWEVKDLAHSMPSISSRDSRWVQAMSKALESVWGTRPVFKREGGTVPVVAQMQSILGIDSVLTGFGLPDDNLHSPNEKLDLPNWYRGIDAFIHFLFNLAG